jgi:transposase-like protein
MKKKRHNADQIMKILGESEGSKSAAEICRSYEISEQTLYRWKRKYGVPKRTRSDNGPEFRNALAATTGRSSRPRR